MANVPEAEKSVEVAENKDGRINHDGYVGVDPIYQNSASVHQKPMQAAEGTTARLVEDTLAAQAKDLEDSNVRNRDAIVQRGTGVAASPVEVKKTAVLPSADRTPSDPKEDKALAKSLQEQNEKTQAALDEARQAQAAEREADVERINQIRQTIVASTAAQSDVAQGAAQGGGSGDGGSDDTTTEGGGAKP